jgi:hypothetical protein
MHATCSAFLTVLDLINLIHGEEYANSSFRTGRRQQRVCFMIIYPHLSPLYKKKYVEKQRTHHLFTHDTGPLRKHKIYGTSDFVWTLDWDSLINQCLAVTFVKSRQEGVTCSASTFFVSVILNMIVDVPNEIHKCIMRQQVAFYIPEEKTKQ